MIKPLPPLSFSKNLESRLSYTKQGAQFFPNPLWAHVKLYSVKTAIFPWGLLDEVLEVCKVWCSFKDDKFTVKGLKIDKPFTQFDPKLRKYQIEAIEALIKNNGGILSMPTGSGKTFTAIEYLKQYNKPSLIIVPTVELVRQWKEQLPDFIDARTYQGIKDYSELNKYDIIVFDECHHCSATTLYKIAMKLKEQLVIGLSATTYREDGEDMKLQGALGNIVYNISLRELIDRGFLCDAVVKWEELDEDYNTDNYQEIYKSYIIQNKQRNDAIISNCLKFHNKKILILVTQIEHGVDLLQTLDDIEEDVIFLNSKSKSMDFKHRIIIATSILDEGIDLPDREVVILAGGGKSSIKVTQRIGRVLRTHESKKRAIIIDFIDKAKYLDLHTEKRKEIYEEYGFNNWESIRE